MISTPHSTNLKASAASPWSNLSAPVALAIVIGMVVTGVQAAGESRRAALGMDTVPVAASKQGGSDRSSGSAIIVIPESSAAALGGLGLLMLLRRRRRHI